MTTKVKNEAVSEVGAAAEPIEAVEAKVRVRVLVNFRDKYTKVIHKKGEELEITTERLAELTKPKQFVRKVR